MRASRYNVFLELEDDNFILAYNCLSGMFAKMERELYDVYLKIISGADVDIFNHKVSNFIKELKKGGFIIEDELDELELIRINHYGGRFVSKRLDITIAPTLECNFACKYCFEGGGCSEYMSLKIEDSILKYVATHISKGFVLHVTWFGGEPTLALDTIYRLSDGFMKIAAEKGCSYSSFMISNGYLLTREVALELKKHHVGGVQIALDGPAELHDKRRPLKNGRGTFDTIISNIREIVDILKVQVLSNVDRETVTEYPKLFDVFEKMGLSQKGIPISLGSSRGYTDKCRPVAELALDVSEVAKVQTNLFSIMAKQGFSLSKMIPKPALWNCGSIYKNSMVIGPNGDIYRCWPTLGNEQERIGHISRPIKKMNQNLVKWLAWDPFEDKRCRTCKVLPLCMGGCPYFSLGTETALQYSNRCCTWKYNLRDILKLIYKHHKSCVTSTKGVQ